MYSVNTDARTFLSNNFITLRNGFENNGLITYNFELGSDDQLNQFHKLEKLYFKALERNIGNRILTINLDIMFMS